MNTVLPGADPPPPLSEFHLVAVAFLTQRSDPVLMRTPAMLSRVVPELTLDVSLYGENEGWWRE
jgi:hypothetical protein